MKNTILWIALCTLIGTQVHADITQPITPPAPTSNETKATPAPASNPGQALPSVQPTQSSTAVINCDYKIPAETKKVEDSVVKSWSEKAVTQAFDFDPANLDAQLQKLQACFTEQGWTGFNTALQKSGNLEAIKSQKLTVSSQVEGQVVITEAKDNQWKITLPLQVVYQNDKEKVTQLLSVDLTVSRKITGDLGITQMIAAPRGTVTQEKTSTPVNINTNPTPNGSPNQGTTPAPTPGTAAPTQTEQPSPTAQPSQPAPAQSAPVTSTPGQATPPLNAPGNTAP